MAILNDPDQLTLSTQPSSGTPDGNVYVDPVASPPTIELIAGQDGLVAADGVTLQALYSFLKEQWKSNSTFIKYLFPMEAITPEQFEFINDWEPLDDTVRSYIRSAGWSEKDASTPPLTKQSWMGCITLGSFALPATHTAYYGWEGDTTKTDFTYPGPVNEAVKIYGDGTHGNIDHTDGDLLTLYIRPDTTGAGSGDATGYTYDNSSTLDIGANTVTYQAYRFPLSSTVDLNITKIDSEVSSIISTKTFTLTFGTAGQYLSSTYLSPDLFGGPFDFTTLIENAANSATPDDVYNVVKYWQRQTGTVDTGTSVYGVFCPDLVVYNGSTLETYDLDPDTANDGGVLIGSVASSETANFAMRDDDNVLQTFPATSSGELSFNSNLVNDAAAHFWMFFDNANGNLYPSANAIIVNEYDTTPINYDLHYVVPTGITGPNSDDDTGGAVGSTTAGSDTMSMAGTNWLADELIDKVLVIESGNNQGYYWITDNTTTTLVVDPPFEATDASMAWEIRNKNTTGKYSYDFDYSGNVQGGRTAGEAANVSVVAVGLRTGQYVVSSGNTINSGGGNNFSITAALERNYSDPT